MVEYYELDRDHTMAKYYAKIDGKLHSVSYTEHPIHEVTTTPVSSGVELHDKAKPIDKSEIPDAIKEEFRDEIDI